MFSLVLIGDWGTGKTTVAATAPKPALFLDIDNKLHKMDNLKHLLKSGEVIQWAVTEPLSGVTLKRLSTMETKPGKSVAMPRPKGYIQLVEMIEKLEKDKCVVNGKKLATIVLDSYTTVDEHLRRLLCAVNGTNTMTLPLYGPLLVNFEELNNTLLRLPCNIILICHEKADKDELTGKIHIKPLINGQMKDKIGKDFEEVYAMVKKVTQGKATYSMNTVGDSMRSCRTSRPIDGLVDADLSKIFGKEVNE